MSEADRSTRELEVGAVPTLQAPLGAAGGQEAEPRGELVCGGAAAPLWAARLSDLRGRDGVAPSLALGDSGVMFSGVSPQSTHRMTQRDQYPPAPTLVLASAAPAAPNAPATGQPPS